MNIDMIMDIDKRDKVEKNVPVKHFFFDIRNALLRPKMLKF
jgi:hypothetical protein